MCVCMRVHTHTHTKLTFAVIGASWPLAARPVAMHRMLALLPVARRCPVRGSGVGRMHRIFVSARPRAQTRGQQRWRQIQWPAPGFVHPGTARCHGAWGFGGARGSMVQMGGRQTSLHAAEERKSPPCAWRGDWRCTVLLACCPWRGDRRPCSCWCCHALEYGGRVRVEVRVSAAVP